MGSNGAVYSYGDAAFLGAPSGLRLVRPSRVSPPPDATSLDEVRPSVGVDARPGHVAVAAGHEVGGEGRDLVGQAGPPEIGGLVEGLADPLS